MRGKWHGGGRVGWEMSNQLVPPAHLCDHKGDLQWGVAEVQKELIGQQRLRDRKETLKNVKAAVTDVDHKLQCWEFSFHLQKPDSICHTSAVRSPRSNPGPLHLSYASIKGAVVLGPIPTSRRRELTSDCLSTCLTSSKQQVSCLKRLQMNGQN